MKKISIILGAALIVAVSSCSKKGDDTEVVLNNEIDSVSYSIGLFMGKNLKKDGFKDLNEEVFFKAMNGLMNEDSTEFTDNAEFTIEEAGNILNNYFAKKRAIDGKVDIDAGTKFLTENAKKAGVVSLPSGLQYEIIKAGKGAKPSETSKVKTHYHGTLIDGTVFDSSVERNEPAEFNVNQVIPGWTEALQLMPVGSKWKLYVPYNLAYGENGRPPVIKPYSTLVFEVELLEIGK